MTDTARPDVSEYQLSDRYHREEGRVFLSGVQAIARLPVDQIRIDRANGLNTAAFVSGYQGSPVGSFGQEVERAAATVPDLPIVHQPGVNEELGATAVMGSQLAATLDDCRYDGVLGIWYGKAPGLDRASDAIRHAVFAGTARHGGAIAVVGDDPSAKSSTLPTSSDATLVDLHMPILFPGDAQEALDLARHAVALSRSCGIWSGLKVVTAVADGTGTIDVHPERVVPVLPEIEIDGKPYRPVPNGRLITPYTLDAEREFHEIRTKLAQQYGVLNALNRATVHTADDWIGIAASGHTYHEVREALKSLGLGTDDDLRAAGIRLAQLLMPVPLDRHDVRRFADGLTDVLVVEEKNPTLELLVRDALYDAPNRPRVWGKHDEEGHVMLPFHGMLDAAIIAPALRHHLSKRVADRLAPVPEPTGKRDLIPLTVNRAPFYCSGCPHNISTRNAPDTLVGGGIGCHGMIALMEPERVGDMVGLTCMGNEGTQWIGMAPFVERTHMVQNLGDGTFFHSGSLAIRAAVAAGIDITYKLLHNGTVAMTGGQDAAGAVDVPEIATMLMAQGVARIIVTSDAPDRFDGVSMPKGVDVWERTRFAEAQEALAATKGTTVLIHDQGCAAEKRRARSRGTLATPGFRVVINERICEGCGDCGDKSNCLSVQPIDTPYGRKTAIHQTSCNFDFSCLQGDCPAFATVTVENDRAKPAAQRAVAPPEDFPTPTWLVDPDEFTVRLSGIGGTGVVTVSQVIGTAAMLDGFDVRGLDQTGLSQKAGPVTSDVRMSRTGPAESNHALAGGVDCYLAFDMLAGAGDQHLAGAGPERTVVIGSIDAIPTGEMVVHPGELRFPEHTVLRRRLDQCSRAEHNRYVDAGAITRGLFGGSATANVFVLGVAVQLGALPVAAEHLERAIELNGVAVAQNVAAFRYGRHWVVDPDAVEAAAGITAPRIESTDQLIDRLAADLAAWGDEAYAERFSVRVSKLRAAEQEVAGSDELTITAARSLHKLMAYKDEYEVARLALLDESRERYRAVGGPDTKVTYHLHPPVLRALGMSKKLKFGKLGEPSFKALVRMKRLRGTKLDPFGHGEVRHVERAMIPEFEAALDTIVDRLTPANHADAVQIAGLPDQVRGYEHIKLRRAEVYRQELAQRLAVFG